MDNIGKEWMHDWNYLLCMISSCYFLIKGLATEKANMGGHGVFFFSFPLTQTYTNGLCCLICIKNSVDNI